MINFSAHRFHPVIALPDKYDVYDFSQNYDSERTRSSAFGIGRYNEKRKGMYTQALFKGVRDNHIGLDIAAPAGTQVFHFYPGTIYLFGNNDKPGDYGHTLITEHLLDDVALYALYGHLSADSIKGKAHGDRFKAGEVAGWVGTMEENGGWNPHLHFQLSYKKPLICDMPGVVSDADLKEALTIYPDPTGLLGIKL